MSTRRETHAGHLAGAESNVDAGSAERGEPVSRLHLDPHRLGCVEVVVDRDREADLVAPGQGGQTEAELATSRARRDADEPPPSGVKETDDEGRP